MLVIWKELGDIPDSSATAAIITATSSPSSTAGAAGAAAGLAAGAADLGAGAAGAFPLPSIAATILEITKMTAISMASITKTISRPDTATSRASPTSRGSNGLIIALSTLGMYLYPLLLTQGDQQIVSVDSGAHGGGHGLHGAVHGGGDLDLHLHGLQHHQHVASLHGLAHGALHLEDIAGHGAVDSRLTGGHSGGSSSGRRSARGREQQRARGRRQERQPQGRPRERQRQERRLQSFPQSRCKLFHLQLRCSS